MRKLIVGSTLALIVSGIGGTAFAGEVTGGPSPKPTPAGDKASSICAFSGQEDGWTLGFDEGGNEIEVPVPTGPGLVQTPHHEKSAGVIHAPGIPRFACRGNG